jgi:hypothetical protein
MTAIETIMNKKRFGLFVFGIIIISITLLASRTASSRQQKSENSNDAAFEAEVYKKLYFARLASDLGMNTAILQRIDRGRL